MSYIQLINTTNNEVVQQRLGGPNEVNHHKLNTWNVKTGLEVICVTSSDYAQPYKFMSPVPKETKVLVYQDETLDTLPINETPTWTGTAFELETMELGAHSIVGESWSAFTSYGKWIGTSEY